METTDAADLVETHLAGKGLGLEQVALGDIELTGLTDIRISLLFHDIAERTYFSTV